MEHRWGERRPIDFGVRFVMMPQTVGAGRIVNISSTGAFMKTQICLRLLSLLYLQPLVASEDENKHIAATVVRREETGVGLEWCEFGANALTRYLPWSAHPQPLADDSRSHIPAITTALRVKLVREAEIVFRR
jgi:hypothetical protein